VKLGFEKKKNAEAWSAIAQGAAKAGRKAAEGVKSGASVAVEKTKDGAAALAEKTRQEAYAYRLKKHNPLFPEKYHDESFHVPNIIVIVDDARKRDIDVCEGAIGWLGKEKGVEILYLYDEAVSDSGLRFVPAATCGGVYHMDSFDRKTFVHADFYLANIQEECAAELEHIAWSLGAKRCFIEMIESEKKLEITKKLAALTEKPHGINLTESAERSVSNQNAATLQRDGWIEFRGSDTPQQPTLKWFAHDSGILQLIAARCSGTNPVSSKMVRVKYSVSQTMSREDAGAIDCVMGAKGKASLEKKVARERESEWLFRVEF